MEATYARPVPATDRPPAPGAAAGGPATVSPAAVDALFAVATVGVAVLDAHLRFVRVNDALAAINGSSPADHVGRAVGDIIPDIALTSALEQVVASGRPVTVTVEGETPAAPGRRRRWTSEYVPIADAGGVVEGIVAVVHEEGDVVDLAAALENRSVQLDLAVAAAGLGVWEWDQETGVVLWSTELERLFGIEPGSFDGTFERYLDLLHPDDRDEVAAAIEDGMRTGAHRVEHRILLPDGSLRWVEGRGAVTRDQSGKAVGMAGVTIDITERVLSHQRLKAENAMAEALHEVSAALSRQRDSNELLRATVGVTSRLTDRSFVAVLVEDAADDGWRVAAHAGDVDEDAVAIAQALLRELAPVGSVEVLSSDDEVGRRRAGRVLEGPRVLVAPMVSPAGHVLAAIVAGRPEVDPFQSRTMKLLAGVAAHAAIALENVRLFEAAQRDVAARQAALEERDAVARLLQASLLPPNLPTIEGIDLAAVYLPTSEGIGGDFYDVFPMRGRAWGVVLGDVCGKGPRAAAVTALTRYTLRTAAMTHPTTSDGIRVLNDAMLAQNADGEVFCTAIFARLELREDGPRLVAAVAGHPPILVLRADGEVEAFGPTGPLVGAFPAIEVGEVEIAIRPGDVCVLYTDGATDVYADGRTFGLERLVDVVGGCRGMTAAAVASSIERAVVEFQHGVVTDDLALVVLGLVPTR